ncbi:hypothetical protein [Kitasatospora purpeofusca]
MSLLATGAVVVAAGGTVLLGNPKEGMTAFAEKRPPEFQHR